MGASLMRMYSIRYATIIIERVIFWVDLQKIYRPLASFARFRYRHCTFSGQVRSSEPDCLGFIHKVQQKKGWVVTITNHGIKVN